MSMLSVKDGVTSSKQMLSLAATLGTSNPMWYPRSMIFALVFGIAFPVALHVHYYKLNGRDVGSLARQQWALFIGTVLAYFTQASLVFAVRIVSVQCLWRALKKVEMSMGGIDSAFQAMSDPLMFLGKEVWHKTPLAMLIALMSWFFPMTTFFGPATLNVETIMRTTSAQKQVPSLSISNPGSFQRYAFTVASPESHQSFRGARTIVSRIGLAAATTGKLLNIPKPETNATYEQVYYGPYVQCSNSTPGVRFQIDEMVHRFAVSEAPASSELAALDYFAAIPSLTKTTNLSIQISNLTETDGARLASNQLWIYLSRYQPSANFSKPREDRYLTCKLYNASYVTVFSWQNGNQNITTRELNVVNSVPYPMEDAPTTPKNLVISSYSAVMLSLATQLTGSVSFYRDLTTKRMYSSIKSSIAETVLIGSSDFDTHFLQNHFFTILYGSGLPEDRIIPEFSDQRRQDMDYVNAKPLDVLISELSHNITISMLTDSLLAPRHQETVLISRPATVYAYQFRNIAIIYPIAVSVATIIVALGVCIFHLEQVSHDISFSSAACSTSGIHSLDLSSNERQGGRPLLPATKRTLLYFDKHGGEGPPGFRLVQRRQHHAEASIEEEIAEEQSQTGIITVALLDERI